MKKLIYFIFLFLVMQIFPDKAFGWGVGTHAYFAEELGTHYGIENLPMIAYGAMAPDMFNLKFRLEYKDYLRDQTHYDFM